MVVDPSSSISRSIRLSAYPTLVVVDKRGRIRLSEAAPHLSRITTMLNQILAEP
jgi:hypothetical protein